MKLVTVSQMRAIEKEADAKGVSYDQMMQNAGVGLAEVAHAVGQENGWDTVAALVGSGNNGGDALVALTWLAGAGWRTCAFLVNRKIENDLLVSRYVEAGGELLDGVDSLQERLVESDVLLDGLLGTGIKLPLKEEAARVLGLVRHSISELDVPPFVLEVDCPSGVDCDTGEAAEETIPADLTLTMAAVKQGLLKLPAFDLLGDLDVVDIGLPDHLDSWNALQTNVADWDAVAAMLPARTSASHKGTFGTAFVIAGSTSYTGAALLAGRAAYRIGAGLVTMAVPEPLHDALAGHLPEATWLTLPHEKGFISNKALSMVVNNLSRATAMLIGPGLGEKYTTKLFVENLLPAIQIPLVVDADGLRHILYSSHFLGELDAKSDWYKKLPALSVLTPHPGEMSLLTGLPVAEIQANREEVARRFAQIWGHVVVLKGAFTIIASPDGRTTVIPVATPALARAGTGDVLAGLIVGLRAQGISSYEAAVTGAFIHAQAGLLAAERLGTTASVLASDVLSAIPDVIAELG
jgi:ADP-dependent NAD(P)H-hydrate dehydratase / NAD(P)H-hydrate epimerase